MYFHVYLIYRFTRTFTNHSSVITRCWGFELQNGKSSLKSPQTLVTQDFAPASFLSTPDTYKEASALQMPLFSTNRGGGARGRATFPRREGGSEGSGVSSRLPTLLYIAPRAFAALCPECYGYITRTQNHLQNKKRFDKIRADRTNEEVPPAARHRYRIG